MTESGGLPEVQHESTVWRFEVHNWPSQRWIFDLSAVTLNTLLWCPEVSEVRRNLLKQSRLTLSKSLHDGIGWSSRSSTWKHRVLLLALTSQSSKRTYVILSIDILWCPDRQRPSETITLDLLQSQSGIGRNQAERTNEIGRFAWQQRAAFSRCLDLLWCVDRHWLCQV